MYHCDLYIISNNNNYKMSNMWRSYKRSPVFAVLSRGAVWSLQRRPVIFLYGCIGGAALELAKIYWQPSGINYYQIRRRKVLARNHTEYHAELQKLLDYDLAIKQGKDPTEFAQRTLWGYK